MMFTRCLPLRKLLKRLLTLTFLILAINFCAISDFWSLKKQPETVKLTAKLPPISARNGNTVKFEAEIAGNSIPPETAMILRERIRTLLLHGKEGGIQLVDDSAKTADTIIKCIITTYEPKVVRPGERKIGNKDQKIETWIGNIAASVQVLDSHNRPIDAAELKTHLENDFITSEKEDKVSSGPSKKKPFGLGQITNAARIVRGGADAGDVAGAATGNQGIHDALSAQDKGARAPTDSEWRDALIEGLAAKVANRIVPVDEQIVAVLPLEKEFANIRQEAQSGHWGDVQEQAEKMGPLSGGSEADRLYLIGLSYEATAYQQADKPSKAAETLNKASKAYEDAKNAKPSEREIALSEIRVQDSLDHYLEIQHFLQNRPQPEAPLKSEASVVVTRMSDPPPPEPPGGGQTSSASDNAALVEMAKAGLEENVLLTFVQTAPEPKFDVTVNGLLQLRRANVPNSVIQAVQKRMAQNAKVSPKPRIPNNKTVPAPKSN
jgi:hypothetical protein